MSQLPTKQQNPNGLHQRYNVKKADGSPVDPTAVYFVMRLDTAGSDGTHTAACRAAARAYANTVRAMCEASDLALHLDGIARDLLALCDELESTRPNL